MKCVYGWHRCLNWKHRALIACNPPHLRDEHTKSIIAVPDVLEPSNPQPYRTSVGGACLRKHHEPTLERLETSSHWMIDARMKTHAYTAFEHTNSILDGE